MDVSPAAASSHYRLVPLSPSEAGAAVRICVVVPVAGARTAGLVLLRTTLEARVYLGALADQGGRVREWLELWVQTVSGLAGAATLAPGLTNAALEVAWLQAHGAARAEAVGAIATGVDDRHGAATWIDLERGETVAGGTAAGRAELCRDDAQLTAAGLPPFSTSLHRYLHVPGEPGRYYAATLGAPANAAVAGLDQLLGGRTRVVGLNPEAGLIAVRRRALLGFDAVHELLSGRAWPGELSTHPAFRADSVAASLDDWDRMQQGGTHLFSARGGRAGRFLETFFLKLRLIRHLLAATRAGVAARQAPYLNLGPDSFRIDLGPPGAEAPLLWTLRVVLTESGGARAAAVGGGGARYFRPVEAAPASVYRPDFLAAARRGVCDVRVRRVVAETGGLQAEATLTGSERWNSAATDLVVLRLPLGGALTEVAGHFDSAEALARGEGRFRSLPVPPEDPVGALLRAAEGVAFTAVGFETLPLQSSPCDLHALGVLAVRLLATGQGLGLGVAVDEVQSFAGAVAERRSPEPESPPQRRAAVVAADPRWTAQLGPHRHGHEPLAAEEALRFLPPDLWWECLECTGRLFPGASPESFCRDYGDAPPRELERVFDPAIETFDLLAARARSLILSDWAANREVASVLQRF